MIIRLPDSLALKPLRADWSESPVDPHRRTTMDDGEIAVTRKLTRVPVAQNVTWELSGLQLELWREFWRSDLDAGRNWFEATIVDGVRNSLRACRPSGETPYTAVSPAGGIYNVSLQLEVREIASLPAHVRLSYETYLACGSETASITARMAAINTALKAAI